MIWYFLRHLTLSLFFLNLLLFVFVRKMLRNQFHQIVARLKHFKSCLGFPPCAAVEIFRSAFCFLKELLLSFILFSLSFSLYDSRCVLSYYWLYSLLICFVWNAAGLFLSSFFLLIAAVVSFHLFEFVRKCARVCVCVSPPPLSVLFSSSTTCAPHHKQKNFTQQQNNT